MNHRNAKNRASRKMSSKPTPITVVNATKVAAVLTITFNQPVSLTGIPQYLTNLSGPTPILASMTSPTVLSLTFSATVATATSLVVPFEEGAIRNASGGYVNAGTFPVT
jgi:hypothetical protein